MTSEENNAVEAALVRVLTDRGLTPHTKATTQAGRIAAMESQLDESQGTAFWKLVKTAMAGGKSTTRDAMSRVIFDEPALYLAWRRSFKSPTIGHRRRTPATTSQ